MRTAIRNRRGAWALGAAFLLAWVAYARLWPQAPFVVSDSPGYFETATDLQDGHLDTLHDRTPGYPALLVATGAGRSPARALFHVQMLLHFAAAGLGAALLRGCGVRRLGTMAFVAVALAPASMAPASQVLTETCTEFLLVAGVAATAAWFRSGRWVWLAAGAAALAAVGLVRPLYLPLGTVMGGLFAAVAIMQPQFRRRCAPPAAVFAASSLLVTGGLVGHNASRFGFAGATPLLGFNLCTRTLRFVDRLPDEYAAVRQVLVEARNRELTERDPAHLGTMYIWNARPALEAATGLDRARLSTYMLRLNLLLIRRAPLEYATEVARAAAVFWFPWVPESAGFGSRAALLAWTALGALVLGTYLLTTTLTAAAAVLAWRVPAVRRSLWEALPAERERILVALGLIGVLAAFTLLVSCSVEAGLPRYRSPIDLLLLVAALLGVRCWMRARDLTRA